MSFLPSGEYIYKRIQWNVYPRRLSVEIEHKNVMCT